MSNLINNNNNTSFASLQITIDKHIKALSINANLMLLNTLIAQIFEKGDKINEEEGIALFNEIERTGQIANRADLVGIVEKLECVQRWCNKRKIQQCRLRLEDAIKSDSAEAVNSAFADLLKRQNIQSNIEIINARTYYAACAISYKRFGSWSSLVQKPVNVFFNNASYIEATLSQKDIPDRIVQFALDRMQDSFTQDLISMEQLLNLSVRFSKLASEKGSEFASRIFTSYSAQVLSFIQATKRQKSLVSVKNHQHNNNSEANEKVEVVDEADEKVEVVDEADEKIDEKIEANEKVDEKVEAADEEVESNNKSESDSDVDVIKKNNVSVLKTTNRGKKRSILEPIDENSESSDSSIDEYSDYSEDETYTTQTKRKKLTMMGTWERIITNLYIYDVNKQIPATNVLSAINRALKDMRRRQIADQDELREVMNRIFGKRCFVECTDQPNQSVYTLAHMGIDKK